MTVPITIPPERSLQHTKLEHLIKDLHWFVLLLITALSIAVLVKGADFLVEGASGLAYRIGMPKVIIGATVVSLGTTSPECAVSVMAAWSGNPGLALGNAVGSIITDTGLIFGLGCLITNLPADRFVLTRQGWVQFCAAMLLAVLCYGAFAVQGNNATLGRWVGVLMLALLVAYMVASIRWSKQHPYGEPFVIPDEVAGEVPITPTREAQAQHESILKLLLMVLIGLAFVILASHVLICAVTELAKQWGVPPLVIAATIVAFGTSLPELVVGMTSIAKGHKEILVGNIIGADILNVLFVIGASAAAKPLPIIDQAADPPQIFLYLHLPTMILVLTIFRLFIFSATARGEFRRWYGVPLVMLYAVYVPLQFVFPQFLAAAAKVLAIMRV